MGRIADFVDKLFDDSVAVDRAAGTGRLGDDTGTVAVDFGDRVADFSEIQVLPMTVQSAGHLRAAFDQVAGDACAGQTSSNRPIST